YVPVPEGFTKGADGSIVLRRIMCDIISASFKYGKFPTLPLPLRAKGGYLDFLYLDQDMRITRGNRGGLFIHFRPEFLDQQF
ncbi:MAG: PAP/fibrillin family protein, partial [bacterium]